MGGALNGYRLRSSHGDTIDPRQPLPIDQVEAQETVSQSDTLTYNGKAAAGAITVNALPYKAIVSVEGDQVASYWGQRQNLVYEAYADGTPEAAETGKVFSAVTETALSADFAVYDANQDLEEMFESLTTTVKRFVAKVIDTSGGTLYGWIMGVADASDTYTFDVMNHRTTETQSWVGTLGNFDNTALKKVEIYHYNSSVVFGTGTTLTEEVDCPKEYSKSWQKVLEYAETLSNGQYFVDYMRGRIVGVKADNTASETVTYNIWASTSTGASGGTATTVKINDSDGDELSVNSDGSLNVSGGSASGASAYSNASGDFTATANSGAKTITFTGLPFTLEAKHLIAGSVKQVTSAGVVSNLPLSTVTVASGVATLSDMSANFASGDTVVVTLIGPDKAYNRSPDTARNEEADPVSQHYVNETYTFTNIANATPEFGYVNMDGFKGCSVHVEKSGGTDTFDVDYEVSNEGSDSGADWIDVTAGMQDLGGGGFTADHVAYLPEGVTPVGLRFEITTAGGSDDADFNVFVKKYY